MRQSYGVEILLQEREQHRVLPLAVTEVRPPLHALADEPDALGVADRALVEAVAGELEAVEAELAEQVALEQPRASSATPRPR